jgi:hypothetical protein
MALNTRLASTPGLLGKSSCISLRSLMVLMILPRWFTSSKTFSPNLRTFLFDAAAKEGIFSLVIWLFTSSKVRLANINGLSGVRVPTKKLPKNKKENSN